MIVLTCYKTMMRDAVIIFKKCFAYVNTFLRIKQCALYKK